MKLVSVGTVILGYLTQLVTGELRSKETNLNARKASIKRSWANHHWLVLRWFHSCFGVFNLLLSLRWGLTGLGPKRSHEHLAALSYQDKFERVGRQLERHADASPDHHHMMSFLLALLQLWRRRLCEFGGRPASGEGGGRQFASCQRNDAAA